MAANVTCGTLHRYRSTSPIYCITVTLYFLQSSQNWLAENLARKTIVAPVYKKVKQITEGTILII